MESWTEKKQKLTGPIIQWHAYNLIRPNDLLRASAIRRVTTSSVTGTTSSSRVHLMLQIRVKSLDFDPQLSQLHVSGQITTETPHTKIGQFHTIDLELQRNFTLEKSVETGEDGAGGWDSVAIEMLKEAVDIEGNRRAEAVAVVMQEGLANICFIGQYQTILKQKVEMTVPKKRQGGASDHDKVGQACSMRTKRRRENGKANTAIYNRSSPNSSKQPSTPSSAN